MSTPSDRGEKLPNTKVPRIPESCLHAHETTGSLNWHEPAMLNSKASERTETCHARCPAAKHKKHTKRHHAGVTRNARLTLPRQHHTETGVKKISTGETVITNVQTDSHARILYQVSQLHQSEALQR